MELTTIDKALREAGLLGRGGFHPHIDDDVPPLPDGRPAKTVVLAGNVGDSVWHPFQLAAQKQGKALSLDQWTQHVLTAVARKLRAHALFPFSGPPYLPFQRWAQHAEPVAPSPIGPLIHPQYGLWHAYRGALAFAERIELPPPVACATPCQRCPARPCLSTCPVGALTPGQFNVVACLDHLGKEAGRECLHGGCLARRACPVGVEFQYPRTQAQFHQQAFLRNAMKTATGDS
jgi:hypothetical protein